MIKDELLTSTDAALVARVSAATIRSWETHGRLPAIRTAGGVRLFTRADVDRVVAERDERRTKAGR